MEQFEDDVKGVDFLAHVNHTLERLMPGHGDLVQHSGDEGFWHPEVDENERKRIRKQLRSLGAHNRVHGTPGLFDETCEWCEQARSDGRCLYPGCQKSFEHDGDHHMYPGWENA